eukprot:1989186-Amphidinium_carterae.1
MIVLSQRYHSPEANNDSPSNIDIAQLCFSFLLFVYLCEVSGPITLTDLHQKSKLKIMRFALEHLAFDLRVTCVAMWLEGKKGANALVPGRASIKSALPE